MAHAECENFRTKLVSQHRVRFSRSVLFMCLLFDRHRLITGSERPHQKVVSSARSDVGGRGKNINVALGFMAVMYTEHK